MKKTLKLIYVLFCNVAITLIILEIILGAFYYYSDKSGIDSNSERIIASGIYEDTNMSNEDIKLIYRELRQQDMQWKSYLHYRFKPMAGKHNTIYENGLRKTVNQALKDSTSAYKIFCFGGSTMYSSGARDAHTIPSELSKLIHKNFPYENVEVTNFGCHGYTRATENIQLQQELIKNNVPDLVIFYDGVNEIISAHQNNEAGHPTNAYNRRKEFKVGHNYKKRIALVLYSSNIYRFVKSLQRKIQTGSQYGKLKSRSNDLAIDIADNFNGLVKVSKSLEHAYGFKVYNFLQPIIYSKKHLSEYEQNSFETHKYYDNLYQISYEHIRNNSLMQNDSTFIDVSKVFDNNNNTIYFDFCHTGELGNKLVAKEIFSHIKTELNPKNKEKLEIGN